MILVRLKGNDNSSDDKNCCKKKPWDSLDWLNNKRLKIEMILDCCLAFCMCFCEFAIGA